MVLGDPQQLSVFVAVGAWQVMQVIFPAESGRFLTFIVGTMSTRCSFGAILSG